MKNNVFYIFFLVCISFYSVSYGQDSTLSKSSIDNPDNFSEQIIYDDEEGTYEIKTNVGEDVEVGTGTVYDFEEFKELKLQELIQQYWRDQNKTTSADEEESLIPSGRLNKPLLGKIFGSDVIDIKAQGSAEIDFKINHLFRDDRSIPEALRGNTSFRLDQDIQVNVVGKIGDKLQLTMKYDTDALFSFDNEMKLGYTGEEDEILKTLELGNVSLPLTGTLITGTQSLFGAKTQLQFGRTTVTAVFSEQKSETNNVKLEGGGQKNEFEIQADKYDEDRHYFVARHFYEAYDDALVDMPFVTSPVDINKIEVWITNTKADYNNARNIFALTNIGDEPENPEGLPDNTKNLNPSDLVANNGDYRDIYKVEGAATSDGLIPITDFERIEGARMLKANEYSYDAKLGFISLNQRLRNDEILAVAYQYTANGTVFQVGEFSNDVNAPGVLILKLLKGSTVDVNHPTWDLMMKNVYSLNAFQVNREDFDLNIMYKQPETGSPIRFIPENGVRDKQIIELMNLDRLNQNGDIGKDGFFDFISNPKLTIDPAKGKVYLPSVEPFGEKGLKRWMSALGVTDEIIGKYLYQELYTSTRSDLEQLQSNNRFLLKGSYKSESGSEIYLNAFNLPKGSVKVTQGSETLTEGADYIVDYSLGRVTITNESKLNAGTPINVSVESRSLFSFQTKRYMGLHVDHRISDDLVFGGTVLNLRESPLTNKINYGEEPINNTIWGVNGSYQGESGFLTRLVDKLPLLQTKEKSDFFINAEFAQFIPGHPDIIDIDEGGTAYIDDFENGQTEISLLFPRSWRLASVPLGIDSTDGKFEEANFVDDIKSGFNRASLNWYQIDDVFYGLNAPSNVKDNDAILEDPYQRDVRITEIFTNKDLASFELNRLRPLNLTFDPEQKGEYNFDVKAEAGISAGISAEGKLNAPETRWGGMMQKVRTTDWEEANIEFIEFWMMDPYITNPDHEGGNLYINIGNISEDILLDSRKSFENGLPTADNLTSLDTTAWGVVSNSQSLIRSFDNANGASQDVGFDGLNDEQEAEFTPAGVEGSIDENYLVRLLDHHTATSPAYLNALEDPSGDNYGFYLSDELDGEGANITNRYARYNGSENNTFNSFIGNGSKVPNTEDINDDNTLGTNQNYYQYEIDLHPDMLNAEDNPHIVQEINNVGPNGETNWYLFRVPVSEYQAKFGPISDFKSIRFIRMFMHGFKEQVTLRFGTLDMVRGNWRRYTQELEDGEGPDLDASLVVSSVNIEENGKREPVNYVLPPGIEREILQGASYASAQNEQSLSLRICDLKEESAKAIFKNIGVDLRNYKRMKMYVHGESLEDEMTQSGELSLFVRLGTDYKQNYYEYELPLEMTTWGDNNPRSVWPDGNIVDISFDELVKLKLNRNDAIRSTAGDPDPVDYTTKFERPLTDGKKIFVRGNPNLGDVRSIMIGVRNTGSTGDKCAEIWVNELRLTDFDQESGWAMKAEMKTSLADFADVNVNGGYRTDGFGSLEQSMSEREFQNVRDFGFNTTVQAGDLFPESFGIQLPVYYGINSVVKKPKYNPFDPDVKYEDALDAVSEGERSELADKVEDRVMHKSFNVSNIKIAPKKKGGKSRFYDLKNLSASYSFTEMEASNEDVKKNIERNFQGTLGYSYNFGAKKIQPFKKSKLFRSRFLRPIKEFHFYLMPKSIGFSNTVVRDYKEKEIRSISYIGDTSEFKFDPIYTQNLNFTRNFNVKYDFSQKLKFTFTSNLKSRFDNESDSGRTASSDVWKEIWSLQQGNARTYHHVFTGSYDLPLKYFPWTDWVKVNLKYNATYDWIKGTLFAEDKVGDEADVMKPKFGNTIQNTASQEIRIGFTMDKLYKKIPFLKRPYKKSSRSRRSKAKRDSDDDKDKDGKDKDKDKKSKKKSSNSTLDFIAGLLTSVKKINIAYKKTEGLTLPGYTPNTSFMGQSGLGLSGVDPGWKFALGDQASIKDAAKGWVIQEENLNAQYARLFGTTLTLKSTIEPIKRFKINLTADRSYSLNKSEFYRWSEEFADPVVQNTNESGNFKISINSMSTSFKDMDVMYDDFLEKRMEIAVQVARNKTGVTGVLPEDENNFPIGFNGTSQEVLIPAFLNVYGGKSTTVALTDVGELKDMIPVPNWTVRYDGLKDFKLWKKKVRTLSITSGYNSTYTVGSFSRNLLFDPLNDPITGLNSQYSYDAESPTDVTGKNFDASGNFIGEYQIAQVSIQEQFNPLIKVDVTLKNNFTSRMEYKTSRTMTLNINSSQLLEENTRSFVIGFGYKVNDIKIFKKAKSKSTVPRTLDFNLDFDFSYSKSLIRNIFDQTQQVNSGKEQLGINASVNYIINEKISANVYFNRNASESFVSTSYPLTDMNFGFKLRYSLTQ